MPMMITAVSLPADRVTAMIMIWIMKSAAARKDISKPPVPMVRKVLTSVLMTALILKNVFPPVPLITLPANRLITGLVKLATENMPLVKKIPNVPVRN